MLVSYSKNINILLSLIFYYFYNNFKFLYVKQFKITISPAKSLCWLYERKIKNKDLNMSRQTGFHDFGLNLQ